MFTIPSKIKNPFERAILEKNWKLLCKLIQTRNVNETTSNNSTPLIFFLHHSVGANVDQIVFLFLQRFSDIEHTYVDDKGIHRESALIEMIGKGSVDFLLDYKANINFQDDNGETALHRAIKINDIPNIKLLIERGANLDIPRSEDGKTARDLIKIKEIMFPILWRQAH